MDRISHSRTIVAIAWRVSQEIAMYTNPDEAAYCISRIARSEALAAASPDSCARASHTGIAKAYAARLVLLTRTTLRSPVASPAMIMGTVNA